jgi:hypothetical protein
VRDAGGVVARAEVAGECDREFDRELGADDDDADEALHGRVRPADDDENDDPNDDDEEEEEEDEGVVGRAVFELEFERESAGDTEAEWRISVRTPARFSLATADSSWSLYDLSCADKLRSTTEKLLICCGAPGGDMKKRQEMMTSETRDSMCMKKAKCGIMQNQDKGRVETNALCTRIGHPRQESLNHQNPNDQTRHTPIAARPSPSSSSARASC